MAPFKAGQENNYERLQFLPAHGGPTGQDVAELLIEMWERSVVQANSEVRNPTSRRASRTP
jgi:hypothetical protein